jgi:hypothetical protein
MVQVADAESVVRSATGRRNTLDALEWITEGRDLGGNVKGTTLLGALVALTDGGDAEVAAAADTALLRAARDVVRSGRDPGMELHDLGRVTPPEHYRRALDEVCRHTRSHGLDTITAAAVMAAQAADGLVIESLCLVAGITYKELRERADPPLPVRADGRWTQPQIEAVFKVIDGFVRGTIEHPVPDAAIRRPAELLLAPNVPGGWDRVQRLLSGGVPYELLLAQRAVGSAWGAHQNSTAIIVQKGVVDDICQRLSARGLSYERVKQDAAGKAAVSLVRSAGADERGTGTGQVNILIGARRAWHAAVAVSVASDGGTANKSGKALLALPGRLTVPLAVVLVGLGWSNRNETAALAKVLRGRVFTERSLDELVDLVSAPEMSVP